LGNNFSTIDWRQDRKRCCSLQQTCRGPQLETASLTEENGLPPRKHDLFSVLEQKNEVSVIAQSWLFDLAEVDNTASAGAEEDGAVQPTLADP